MSVKSSAISSEAEALCKQVSAIAAVSLFAVLAGKCKDAANHS